MAAEQKHQRIQGWACPHCGVKDVPVAPSGRCAACESAVDETPVVDGPTYFIGEVAEQTGLSLRSLRYYEEAGLVLPAGRTSGGFRVYTDDAVTRVRVIMQMKPLGFSLDEMGRLLSALDRQAKQPDKSESRETVAMFATLAEERCRHLREQLVIAETFSAQLRTELG